MNYGEVLENAWKIIWKHKVLWIFGLLASCSRSSGGGGGGGGIVPGTDSGFNSDMPFGDLFPWAEGFSAQIEQVIIDSTIWIYIAAIIAIILIISLIFFILGTIGRIGLVYGAWKADDGAEHLSFGELWRESLPFFWRVLLLILLVGIFSAVIVLIILIPIIFLAIFTLGIGLICLLPLICLLIPLLWLISLLLEQSIIAVIGEGLGTLDGLKRGWEVITSNLGPYALMALILFIGGGIIGILISLPVILIIVPVLIGFISESKAVFNSSLVIAGLIFLIYLPVAIALNSILQAYLGTAWTLTFRRLTGRNPIPAGDLITVEPCTPD